MVEFCCLAVSGVPWRNWSVKVVFCVAGAVAVVGELLRLVRAAVSC